MPQKRYAYLIGANGPEHQSVTPLQYAEKDIEHLQKALGDYPCEFSDVKSTIATNPSDVLTDLERLATSCERSDLLMVHFSGHGKVWGGHLYLICNTTQVSPRPLLSTAININQIKDILDQCYAKHKLLVLDCCHASIAHAGGAWRGEQELEIALQAIKGSVSAILSACAPHKPTRELDTLELYHDRGAGFLSWALAAACSEYFTTVSRDGALSLSDVLHWLPGARDRINEELEPDGQIPLPRLLSERDIAGDDEVWFTERRRGYTLTTSLEERQQREEHALHAHEPFLRQYCSGVEIGDFDEEKILAYARKQQGFSRLPLGNVTELCKRLGLASSIGTPRRSAVLAFHRFPNRYIPPAVIRVTLRTLDNSVYSRDTIEGFLGEQVEKAIQWLISNLRTIREDVEVGQRIDRCEISEKALQELVVNAVLHRDYEANESIQIKITPKQVLITNPGRLNPVIAESESPFSYRESHPRNPELLDVLVAQRWAEGIAHGFEIIMAEFQKYGLPLPEITNLPGGLVQAIIQRPDISTISDSEMTDSANVSIHIPDKLIVDTASAIEEKEASIWHVPSARNPYFIGRRSQLKTLHTLLTTGKQVALTQAISGLGGIGKTQLALEYAYQYQKSYHDIFWVNADTEESLFTSYVLLADVLHLPERKETDREVVVQAVLRWLRKHTGWLLIFDNLEDLYLLSQFVPVDGQGSVLLTTRRQVTEPIAQALELDTFPENDALLFLLKRAKVLPIEGSLEEASEQDFEEARAVTQLLGNLPLALDQAGAYILETPCSFAEYIALFQTYQRQLLQRRTGENTFTDHPASVATTFRLNFQKVQQRSNVAGELLRFCAFLAPDMIPEEILTADISSLGPVLSPVAADPLQLNEAIEVLRAYSLIRRDPTKKTLSIHRLVQAVLQDMQNEAERRKWAERAIFAVNAAFPHVEQGTWPQCERLLPQALVATHVIEQYQIIDEEAGRLLHETASYLQARAHYAEAEPLFQRALHIFEQQVGPEHSQVATSLNALAILYREQGKYAEAEPLFQRALHIFEQQVGSEHSQVASPLNNLAILYMDQGKYAEAEPLFQRALHIFEQQVGPEHSQVATSLNALAILYREQGKYAEAEPLFQRALHIFEQQVGPEHSQMAAPLNNLALLAMYQGKYAEAEPLFQRALHIFEQQVGPEHSQVATSLNALAILYREQGKYAEAEPLFQRALHIFEQQVGSEHPNMAYVYSNLAALYLEQGKYAEAEPLFQRALHIFEQRLGLEHPQMISPLNSLADLYLKQGKYAEAEPLYQRALGISERGLGSQHPETAETIFGFARLREVQGNSEEARSLYTRALTIREQAIGTHHPQTTETRKRLIALLHVLGQREEAAQLEATQTE